MWTDGVLTQTAPPPPLHHPDTCAAGGDGVTGCRLCVDACPYGALHGDPRRASEGFNVNDAMRRNDDLDNTPLVDNAGGATVFLDSRVKVERV